jgi:ABC-type transporter Mla MlaB component
VKGFSCNLDDGVLILNGNINVDSLGDFVKENKTKLSENFLVVDCANITHADSSFLAFLLYLQKQNKQIVHANLPSHLSVLIELYNLNTVLNLK